MPSKDERGTYEQLEQSLTGVDETTELPKTTATPMMEVVAPATLPENYTFEANVGDRTVSVVVPPGGVEKGQRFTTALPEQVIPQRTAIPVGHWKDGLCNIFAYGPCHAALWNSFFCLPIAAGQVVTRLKLTWRGKEGSNTVGSFQIIFGIVVTWIVIHWGINLIIWFDLLVDHVDLENPDAKIPGVVYFLAVIRDMCFYSYLVYTIYLLKNIRSYVRSKYAIPENPHWKTGCEDTICAVACPCLTAAQMLRHTTDYETYPSVCCSESGLPPSAPSIV